MALDGTYGDFNKDLFLKNVMHESQDKGSRLTQLANIEMMEGNKTYFNIIGAVNSTVKTARLEARNYAAQTHERRQVQEVMAEYSTAIDVEDLIKNVANPKQDLIAMAIMEMGRVKDDAILAAIAGNAMVTTNGTTAAQALTQSIAVNNATFTSGSGDVGLTAGKLKLAKTMLEESYGWDGVGRLICVAPSRQLANLTTESQMVSGDFRSNRPLEGPGTVSGLSGFMGIDFISFERTGVDANADEKVFLLSENAVKLGIYKPLYVDLFKDRALVGSPDAIAIGEAIGATRTREESVVEILCDPLA